MLTFVYVTISINLLSLDGWGSDKIDEVNPHCSFEGKLCIDLRFRGDPSRIPLLKPSTIKTDKKE